MKFPAKSERRFDFKIKIIQTDLTADSDVYHYLNNLNNSSVPFMVQHSDYIEKLDFINSFGGGTLARNQDKSPDRYFERGIFQVEIANPAVLEEVERKKEEMRRSVISEHDTAEDFLRDFFGRLAENIENMEEWEFEDVDIPGNLYMFDMMNGIAADEEDFYEEEDTPAFSNNLEVKFDTTGSIKFLEDNILEVKYDESGMTGEKDAFVRFLFDFDEKDFVTIHRGGQTDIWLNCEKGERVNSSAKSRSFGNGIAVNTKEIINNITPHGGHLCISYIRETNGTPSEMITHVISASPKK